MRGKKVNQELLFDMFDRHPDATIGQLMKMSGLSTTTLYRHRAEWKKSKLINDEKPRLTVPHRYTESTVRLAVLGGFIIGAIFTIAAAYVAGVL